jgi:hypothetical protein
VRPDLIIAATILTAGVALSGAAGAEPACKGSPAIRECRVFHDAVVFQRSVDGIIAFSQEYSADAPWWRLTGERALPAALLYELRRNPTIVLHGDVEACFRRDTTPDETVCVESMTNLVVRIPQYD